MDLITGMDYRNGHLYVSLSIFHLVFRAYLPRMYTDSDTFENHVIKVQLNVFRTMGLPRSGTHMYMLIGHCHRASIFYSFLLLFTAVEHPLVISIHFNDRNL